MTIVHHGMMTSSNVDTFCVTDPLCGEFTGHRWIPTQRPVMRSFDVFFDLRLNKRLSKQLWGWWLETPSCPLWRHCNGLPWRHRLAVKMMSSENALNRSEMKRKPFMMMSWQWIDGRSPVDFPYEGTTHNLDIFFDVSLTKLLNEWWVARELNEWLSCMWF